MQDSEIYREQMLFVGTEQQNPYRHMTLSNG